MSVRQKVGGGMSPIPLDTPLCIIRVIHAYSYSVGYGRGAGTMFMFTLGGGGDRISGVFRNPQRMMPWQVRGAPL